MLGSCFPICFPGASLKTRARMIPPHLLDITENPTLKYIPVQIYIVRLLFDQPAILINGLTRVKRLLSSVTPAEALGRDSWAATQAHQTLCISTTHLPPNKPTHPGKASSCLEHLNQ